MEIIDPLGQSLCEDAPSVTRPMRQSLAQSQRVDPGSYGRYIVDNLGDSRCSITSKVDCDISGSAQVTLLGAR